LTSFHADARRAGEGEMGGVDAGGLDDASFFGDVAVEDGQPADQSVAPLGRLQQNGSAIRTALPLIELQHRWLDEKFGKQYTLCRGKVDHAEASPVTQTLS
jgi:hypothetical protein